MNEQNLFITKLYWFPFLLLLVFTSCKDSFNFEPSLESLTVEKMVDAGQLYPDEHQNQPCTSIMASKKGFMCVGYYYSSEGNEYINTITTWDNEGNRLGMNEFSSPKSNNSLLFNSVDRYIKTSDGSLVALGLASSLYTAFKFNSDGEFLWEKELLSYNDYNRYSFSLFESNHNYTLLASDNALQTNHSKFEILKDGSAVNEEVTESDFRRFTIHRISNEKAIYVGANNGSLSAIVKVVNLNGSTIKEKEYPTNSISIGVRLVKSRSYLLVDNQSHVYKTDNNLEVKWNAGLAGFNYLSSDIVETDAGNILYNSGDNLNIHLYSVEGDGLDEYTFEPNNKALTPLVKLTNGNFVLATSGDPQQLIFFNTK